MRAVIQRVSKSTVSIDNHVVGQIGAGLTILLGISQDDSEKDVHYLVDKIAHLRIFEDEKGKMNRSLVDVGGAVLIISQFTLLADCRKGRRPSFIQAAAPKMADQLYKHFIERMITHGIDVQTGRFGAMMQVSIINEGPVTIIMDSSIT
ncbi:MAG: D-aminoacyl-tRNA deacylase [Desulfobacteraceae bacterium]|jgi:D-tyrosyl-tRNA(Tyr) deacylase